MNRRALIAAVGGGLVAGCMRTADSPSEGDQEDGELVGDDSADSRGNDGDGGGLHEWSVRADGPLTRPTVGDDRVFVGSVDRTLYAIDRSTGDVVWTVEQDDAFSAPTVVNGAVHTYVDGSLLRLDSATGEIVGEARAAGTMRITPELTLIDQTVISSAASGYIAFDQVGGTELWRSDLGGRYGPAIGEEIVVFGSVYDTPSDGRSKETEVHALDIETGEVVWSLQREEFEGENITVSFAILDGIVGMVIDTGIVCGIDTTDGTVLWETKTSHRRDPNLGGNDVPTPIGFNGQFVICSEDVQAIDIETGKRNWAVGSGLSEIRTRPLIVDETVYYPTSSRGDYVGVIGVTADGELATEVGLPEPFEELPAVGKDQEYYVSHSDATLRKYMGTELESNNQSASTNDSP